MQSNKGGGSSKAGYKNAASSSSEAIKNAPPPPAASIQSVTDSMSDPVDPNKKHVYSIAQLRALSKSKLSNKKPEGIPPEIERSSHPKHSASSYNTAPSSNKNIKHSKANTGNRHPKSAVNPEWASAPSNTKANSSGSFAGDSWRSGANNKKSNSNAFSPNHQTSAFDNGGAGLDEPEPEWADVSVGDLQEAFDFTGRVLDRDKDRMMHSDDRASPITNDVPESKSQPDVSVSKKLSRFGFALEEDDPSHKSGPPIIRGPPPGMMPVPAPVPVAVPADPSYSIPDSSRFAFVASPAVPVKEVKQAPAAAGQERSRFGFALEPTSGSVPNAPNAEQSRFAFANPMNAGAAPAGGMKVSLDGLFQMANASELPPMPQLPTATPSDVPASNSSSSKKKSSGPERPSYVHSYMRTYGNS